MRKGRRKVPGRGDKHDNLAHLSFMLQQSLSIALCAAANAFGTPGGGKYMVRADVIPGWLDASLSGEAACGDA